MAKIKIARTCEWNNRAREIGVYLDKRKIGTISNGETKEFEVPTGQHKLSAKIDWCGSQELSCMINETETKTVTISGFKFTKFFIPIFGSLIPIHLILNGLFKITFIIWLIIPACLILAYYLTLGRNYYLVIREDSIKL
jgi:hypothetical protein